MVGRKGRALLGAVTFAEVLAGLAVSFWVDRRADRRGALFAAIGSLLIGLLCLALAPLSLAWVAAVLAGLGIGALFPLSLIVAMDHGRDAGEAGPSPVSCRVAAMGWRLLPLMAGMLRQHLADLTPAWWLMAGLCLVMGNCGPAASGRAGFRSIRSFPWLSTPLQGAAITSSSSAPGVRSCCSTASAIPGGHGRRSRRWLRRDTG
jgi:cyanate permease